MLQPKRTKYRRSQKGRMRGNAQRGHELAFGSFGIKALENMWIEQRQIEAARGCSNSLHAKTGSDMDSYISR